MTAARADQLPAVLKLIAGWVGTGAALFGWLFLIALISWHLSVIGP
jgi:hypothetical protein